MVMLHVASRKVQLSWQMPTDSTLFTQTSDCEKQIYQLWHFSQQLTSTHTEWCVDFSNLYNDANNGESETVPKCRSWFNYIYRLCIWGSSFLMGLATRQTDNLQQYYRTVTHIVCVCGCVHTYKRTGWVKFWKHRNFSSYVCHPVVLYGYCGNVFRPKRVVFMPMV